jgi:ribosome maturation factor RimP
VQGQAGTERGSVEGRVAELAVAQASPLGLAVLEVTVTPEQPSVVHVVVDVDVPDHGRVDDARTRPASVDIDAIAQLSRSLGETLTTAGVTPDDATLEVSSPGVDRPLRDAHDLVRNLGRDVEVHLHDEGSPAFRGRLIAVEDGGLELMPTDRREGSSGTQRLELGQVAYALPVLPW